MSNLWAKSGIRPEIFAVLACLTLILGCGGSPSEDIVEKAIETAASEDGKQVDVEVHSSSDDGAFKMSMKSEDENIEIESSSSGDSGEGAVKITSKTDEGEMRMTAGEGATLPENLPKDVPTYEGMKITLGQSIGENAFNVMGLTQDPVDEVADSLAASAKEQGWEEKNDINQTNNNQQMRMIEYAKENRTLNIIVVSSPEGTNVNITTASEN